MNIDIIGTINNTDNTDPDNPIATQLPGFHVNSTEPIPEWEQYRVNPKSPRQVFWGVEPVCYSFPSEQAYLDEAAKLWPSES